MNFQPRPRTTLVPFPRFPVWLRTVIVCFVISPAASAVSPLQFNLTTLSADLGNSEIPVINGDNVVWVGWLGADRQVYRYNISTGIRNILPAVSPGPNSPAIDGNYVAWDNADKMNLHNLSTGITTVISNDPYTLAPKISGNHVVWIEGRAQDSATRLMDYNIATQTAQQLVGYVGAINGLQISGNDIVWYQGSGFSVNSIEIFHYSLLTGVKTPLTSNAIPDNFPQVSDGNVVWQTYDSESAAEIFRRNLQTGVTERLTNNSTGDGDPHISGSNVAWVGATSDILYRNLATGTTTNLTNSPGYPVEFGQPRISGANAMWFGTLTQGGWEEVFYRNLADGSTTQVTNNTIHESYGDISGQNIAFLRVRSLQTNKWDVILATPIPEPATAPLISLAGVIAVVAFRPGRQLR